MHSTRIRISHAEPHHIIEESYVDDRGVVVVTSVRMVSVGLTQREADAPAPAVTSAPAPEDVVPGRPHWRRVARGAYGDYDAFGPLPPNKVAWMTAYACRDCGQRAYVKVITPTTISAERLAWTCDRADRQWAQRCPDCRDRYERNLCARMEQDADTPADSAKLGGDAPPQDEPAAAAPRHDDPHPVQADPRKVPDTRERPPHRPRDQRPR